MERYEKELKFHGLQLPGPFNLERNLQNFVMILGTSNSTEAVPHLCGVVIVDDDCRVPLCGALSSVHLHPKPNQH